MDMDISFEVYISIYTLAEVYSTLQVLRAIFYFIVE